MARYNKVLLAVDFAADNDTTIDKAAEIVKDNDAELLLVHVNEPVLAAYPAGAMAVWSTQYGAFEADVHNHFKKKMDALAGKLGVPSEKCFLPGGNAALEIKKLAVDQQVDLIVIGTHGRHGLGLLLGSTANGVLHGVACDVLAVRTRDSG